MKYPIIATFSPRLSVVLVQLLKDFTLVLLFRVVISVTIWNAKHILSFSCHLFHFAANFLALSYTKMAIFLTL